MCLCLLAGAKAVERLVLKGLETIAPLVRSVEETPEPIPTEVQGTIPSWIHGNLLRNGPGKFEFGNRQWVLEPLHVHLNKNLKEGEKKKP